MKPGASASFGSRLKTLREAAGFTQEELATIAGLSVHAVSALERGERTRPHVETIRALSAALDLGVPAREALMASARPPAPDAVAGEPGVAALPVPPTPILGRDADLETLRRWIADPAVRLITLVGPGGVGKTRLAIEVARAIAADRATRVAYVPLAPLRDPELVALAMAEAIGLTDVPAMDLARRAPAALDRPTVLVLDNFEQVMDAVWLVADLLASAPALRVLVTSRAPLRIRGEREYPVGPLALDLDPDTTSPADLVRASAIRLFVERVRDVRPDFRLTSSNGGIVAAICRRLDALPLALELAAPWMKVLSVDDLLARLTDVVLRSTAGPRDLPERQQTITSTVAWSYQLLGRDEQRAFRRLSVVPGRFSMEAAAASIHGTGARDAGPSGDAVALVAALIDKSLLLRADASMAARPHLRMLETIRACAAAELRAEGERDDALDGLARYCMDESLRATIGLIGPQQMEWLDRVRDDLDCYRAVMSWLLSRGRVVDAADIACKLMLFWVIRGHSVEAQRWYEQMLAVPDLPPVTHAKLLMGASLMHYTHGDADHARAGLDQAIAMARDAGDVCQAAQIELLCGHVEQAAGYHEAARGRFAACLPVFREMPIPWSLGSALCGLAKCELDSDPIEAEALVAEAESVLTQAGPWSMTLVHYVRAMLALRRGQPDAAIAVLRQSLILIRTLQDKFAFVYAVVPLAAAAVIKGDDVWAARILGARDAVTERTGATVVDTAVLALQAHAEREARARLGPDRWAGAYAAGRKGSIDTLLREIDRGGSGGE